MKVYGLFLLDSDGYTYSSCELVSLWKTEELAVQEKERLTKLIHPSNKYQDYEVVGYTVQE